jgi:RNA-binding protein YlmH
MNEQELCRKRLLDLSKQARYKGRVVFSDFLNLNELNIYHQLEKEFDCSTESSGGIPYAERQIVAFIPDALYYADEQTIEYPICAIKISPSHPKFAEKLSHRDILGSIMSLGVDRSKIGDIVISDEGYFMLCEESIADYFIDNLTQIRHTSVKLAYTDCDGIETCNNLTEKEGIVSSNRLDAMISCVYKLSRSDSMMYITSEKVFVNGRTITNSNYSCKDGDIVSVRGMGRFIFTAQSGLTNKGRLKIKYQLYVK